MEKVCDLCANTICETAGIPFFSKNLNKISKFANASAKRCVEQERKAIGRGA